MKFCKKQIFSLLLSTTLVLGSSAVSAAEFSSGTDAAETFSEENSSGDDLILLDPEDTFSDQTSQEELPSQ